MSVRLVFEVESENKSPRNASPNRLDKTEFAW